MLKQQGACPATYCAIGTLILSATFAASALADGRLDGQLSNGGSGIKFEGAIVRIEQLNLETSTARDGRYVFPTVKAGRYTLTVEYLGASKLQRSVDVIDNEAVTVNFQLTAKDIEHMKVVGQAAGTNRALNRQRSADNIVTVVSADAIGQFPDNNVSEALGRLPGLSIERDQGEGRFVRVRGLAPDLNSVTINGSRVPSPEGDRRAVALDVLPADLLESLEVTKTLTPDMDADSLGGTIEVKSLSAFDRGGLYYSLSTEGSYDEHIQQWSPKYAATVSELFSIGGEQDNVGIALSASWYDRDFGSDNVETGGKWDFDSDLTGNDLARLEEFEQRDYTINRKRFGLALNIEYKPSDSSHYYLRTLYSTFEDQETRYATVIEFEDAVLEGQTAAAEVTRELKDRNEQQDIQSFVLGGSHIVDAWTIDYSLGISKASEEKKRHIDGPKFEAEFDDVGFTNTREPRLIAPAAFFDSAAYELDEVEVPESYAEDREHNIRVDFTREIRYGDNPGSVKLGAKASRREKDSDENVWIYEDFDDYGIADSELLLSAFAASEVDYELGRFGPAIATDPVRALINRLPAADFFDELESSVNDFDIEEDIDAAYIMTHVDLDSIRVLGGVRYERTNLQARGTGFDGTSDEFFPRDVDNDYDNWLPSLHFRYKFGERTLIRAAWTNVVVRPTFEELAPGFFLEAEFEDDPVSGDPVLVEQEASFGDPELDPWEASNVDLGFEHYFDSIGSLSAFLFYKDIDNFIYAADLGGAGAYVSFDSAETFVNGDSAELYGLELSLTKQFSELPAPWNGLLLGVNATFTDSEATIAWFDDGEQRQRDIALPGQSDTTANLVIGYESDFYSLNLSVAYKSNYLDVVEQLDDQRFDIYEDDHLQIDITAKVFVTRQLQVYLKAINVNDESFYTYTGNSRYNAQYEEYGPTYQLGVKYTNF